MQNDRIKHECTWYRKKQTDIKNIDCIIRKISENYPEVVIPQDSSLGTNIDESCPCRSKDTAVDVEVKSERYFGARNFFVKFDLKNDCKNEFQVDNEKSCN